jgi:hypothetical protein
MEEVAPLARWANKHHVAVVLIHHITKYRSGDIFEAIAGSVSFLAAVDLALALDGSREQVQLKCRGRRAPPFGEEGLTLTRLPNSGWQPCDTPQVTGEGAKLFGFLREHDPCSKKVCAEGLGKTEEATRKLLQRLGKAVQYDSDTQLWAANL